MDPRNQGQNAANPNYPQGQQASQWTQQESDANAKQYAGKQPIVTRDQAKRDEPVTKEDRVTSLISSYAHGLENNSPRTPAELAELRYLLDHKGLATIELAPEQYAARDAMLNVSAPRMTLFDALKLDLEVGSVVPSSVRSADVSPAMVEFYNDWKGYSYFTVGDDIVLLDAARKVVGIVGAPDRSKEVPPTEAQVKQREAAVQAEKEREKQPA